MSIEHELCECLEEALYHWRSYAVRERLRMGYDPEDIEDTTGPEAELYRICASIWRKAKA